MYLQSKYNAVMVFALASMLSEFGSSSQGLFIYPRDRIFNLAVSVLINAFIIYLIRYIDFSKNGFNILAAFFILYRIAANTKSFSEFFSSFYGSNIEIIFLVTVALVAICIKFDYANITKLHPFFVLVNIALFILVVLLCFGKINVINIYSTQLNISISPHKLSFFSEIIVIRLLYNKDEKGTRLSVNFLCLAVCIIAFLTMLQGLCIGGTMLYSISPLQSLMQIFSGKTIKKFDYITALLQSLNYYASVIFLMWGLKHLKTKKGISQNENV